MAELPPERAFLLELTPEELHNILYSEISHITSPYNIGTWHCTYHKIQARRQGGAPRFFSLIIAYQFTVLNCMSNRLRLHAILSIS